MMLLGLLLLVACHGVEGNAILGRDLAAADARFAAMPPEKRLGYAPMPGAQRTLSASELKRAGAQFGIDGEFQDVCFEYSTRRLGSAEITGAMRESLKDEGAELEIVEFSLYPAPKGVLVFPLNGLGRPSHLRATEPVMWRGYVEYSDRRKFSVWAKVRIMAEQTRVVAAEDLPIARPIQASQLRLEKLRGFPSADAVANTLEQVEGHTLRRAVRRDAAVPANAIENAVQRDVNRGELIEVGVEAGMAHLKFEARAESGGAIGDTVTVRNAKSGRTFSARVVGKAKVEVAAGTNE